MQDVERITEWVCPSCGEFVNELDEISGWCFGCSPVIEQQLERYLSINADKLEYYILQGKSLYQAIDTLANPINGHRPTCVVCGQHMPHAPKNSIFCRRNKTCRKYSRRYVYLYRELEMSKSEALALILAEIS